MVKTLTSWRTLLLLVVVIYHCDQQWLMEPTKAAVSIFFISSGFLLSMRHPVERFSWSGWKRFVLHSASKLYPLQWLGLAILLLFQWIFIVPKVDASLLAHVALVQSWIPVREIFFGYNGHAWFWHRCCFATCAIHCSIIWLTAPGCGSNVCSWPL